MLRNRIHGFPRWLSTAVALLIVALMLFPLAWVVLSAFQPAAAFFDSRPSVIPKEFTLANLQVLTDQIRPLITTILVATFTAIFSLVVATPAAYALGSFGWRRTPLWLFLILVTQIVPAVLLATPLFLIFSKLGLLNSISGLVIANSTVGIPFALLILTAFMVDFPKELREAAYVDGAGEWRTLISVVLPPSRSAVIAAGLFCFLFAWGDFIWALTLNTNGTVVPLSLSIYSYFNAYIIDWGAIMMTASFSLIPALLLLVIAQRYISIGLTAGAVKE